MTNYLDKEGTQKIVDQIKTKVDAVEGKGLSTNDLTDELLNKLENIEEGATAITVDTDIDGESENPVENKAVSAALDTKAPSADPTFTGTVTVPTASEGDNSTTAASTAFVTTAIATAVGDMAQQEFQIVETLPDTGDAGVFYLIANEGEEDNVYDEYIYVNENWELIGTTKVSLDGYVQEEDLVAITSDEIDAMFA